MVAASPKTKELAGALFSHDEIDLAIAMLEDECADNLPLIGSPSPEGLERIRFAALRASSGSLDELENMVKLAQIDWRDLLVTAGFGDSVDEHRRWAESVLAGG